jgi:hypothetical protein
MKIKLTIIAVLMLVLMGLSFESASAAFCPTSNPSTGVGCTLDNYNYFCNGACQLNSLVPSCGTWTPTPVIAPNYATTTTAVVSTAACTAADACGVCTTCSGGYPNKCGTYPNVFCKANFAPSSGQPGYVANCTAYTSCTEVCNTCTGGYALCAAQNKCTQIISCLPGQTFNTCTGVCDGAAAILKLGVDSVSGTNLIQSASASYSTLFISQLNRVGIGTSTPSTYLQFGGSGQTINMSGTRIGGLDLTPLSADEAVPLGYLQANYAPVSSAFWTGSSTGSIYNTNTLNVGIGTTNPGVKLDVVGGSIRTSNQFISTVGYGTAPFSVISTTTVTNLSANYLGFGSVGATPSSSPYAKLTAGIITLPEFSNSEAGTITIRGWNASYYSWQLIGNNTPWNRAELYFRTGPDGSWGTAYKLWHSGNLTSGLATSSVVKWNGSSLANSLLYDNGTNVSIGTTTPSIKFQVSGGSGQVINVSGGKIGGLDLVPLNSDEAVPLGYLQSNYLPSASELWKGTKNGNIWNGDSGAGNVGIGTSTPTVKLHVIGSAIVGSNDGTRTQLSSNGGIEEYYSTETTPRWKLQRDVLNGSRPALIFGTGVSSSAFGSPSSATLGLFTAGNERVRVDNIGYVGIGTTTPTQKLQVIGGNIGLSNNSFITWRNNGSAVDDGEIFLNTTNQLEFWSGTGNAFIFKSNNGLSEFARINSLGYLGIGTTSPVSKLHVYDSGGSDTYITLENAGGAGSGFRFLRNPTGYDNGFKNNAGIFYITTSPDNFVSENNRLSVDYNGNIGMGGNITAGIDFIGASMVIKSGNVGIGTTSPSTKLQIAGGSGQVINVSGARIGGLDLTPISSDDAVPLGYLQANYFTAASSTEGITSIFLTATTYNGSFVNSTYTGYDAGNKICAALVSGSHFCRTDEIVFLIQKNGAVGFSGITGDNAWIADGPPGFTGSVAADDCGGWTDATNNKLGHFWMFSSSGGGRGSLSSCDTMKKIACCK